MTLEAISITLSELTTAIAALPSAVATAVVAALPPQAAVDTSVIEKSIADGFAALTAEIKNNVEGAAPAPTDTATAS